MSDELPELLGAVNDTLERIEVKADAAIQKETVVNVSAPVVHVAAPALTVQPTPVNVPVSVNVPRPPAAWKVKINRDAQGRMTDFDITEKPKP